MQLFEVMDRAPVSRFHRRLLIACCGGPFLDGYVLSLIGVALIGLTAELDASSTQVGLIGAAALVGILFGATIFGPLTDKIGREKMYALDLTVLVLVSFASAFVTDAWQLIVLRFILGLAVGADYPIATSLLTEFTPTNKRGFMIGLSAVAWSVGAMFAFIVGFAFVQISGGYEQWRWMLATAGALGVLVVLARRGIPESPRWLLSKGRVGEAEDVVEQVYGQRLALQAGSEQAVARTAGTAAALRTLVTGGYLKRTVMCGILYFAQITPQYALYTFGPVILLSFGLVGGSLDIVGSLAIGVLFALGTLPALKLVETWGRRPMTVVPFAIMAISLLALWAFPTGPAWFVIAAFCIYATASGGPSILEWIYPNELFPPRYAPLPSASRSASAASVQRPEHICCPSPWSGSAPDPRCSSPPLSRSSPSGSVWLGRRRPRGAPSRKSPPSRPPKHQAGHGRVDARAAATPAQHGGAMTPPGPRGTVHPTPPAQQDRRWRHRHPNLHSCRIRTSDRARGAFMSIHSALAGNARPPAVHGLRVGFFGAGAMAVEVAKALVPLGHRAVAAMDVRPPGPPLDDVFVPTLDELGARIPDVIVHATPRDGDVKGEILRLLDLGCPVVSMSGISHLAAVDPEATAEIDHAARERGIGVIGTGINPGFVLDLVPIFFAGACVEVAGIHARRVFDLGSYGESVLAMYGIGLSAEEFEASVRSGRIGLHRELIQSVHLVADALGRAVSEVEEQKLPVLADGRTVGFRHVCRSTSGIELEMRGLLTLDAPGHTTVTITGDPDLTIVLGGGVTDRPERVVAARVVNLLPWLLQSTPGFHTPAELPVALAPTTGAWR